MSDFFHPKRQAVSALEPYRFSTTWSTGEVLALDARFTLTVTAERIRSRPCLSARNGQRVWAVLAWTGATMVSPGSWRIKWSQHP